MNNEIKTESFFERQFWIFPILFLIAISALSVSVWARNADWGSIAQSVLEKNSSLPKLSEAELDRIVEGIKHNSPIVTTILTSIGIIIDFLATSFLFFFVMKRKGVDLSLLGTRNLMSSAYLINCVKPIIAIFYCKYSDIGSSIYAEVPNWSLARFTSNGSLPYKIFLSMDVFYLVFVIGLLLVITRATKKPSIVPTLACVMIGFRIISIFIAG